MSIGGRTVPSTERDIDWVTRSGKEIGLEPTATGAPGGQEIGQSVTHYIVPGGRYAKAYAKLQASGFRLRWQSAPPSKQAKAKWARR